MVSIRLDCSGLPNYQRKVRDTSAIAPLRENYAYILSQYLLRSIETVEETTVIDPMCGSGTFLSEIINQNKYNDQRNFSYQYFSFFRKKNSFHLKKPLKKDNQNISLFGIEKNHFLKQGHIKNFKSLPIQFLYKDFFEIQSNELPTSKKIAICNLPYGKRIKISNPIKFYKKFVEQSLGQHQFHTIGILLPTAFAKKIKLPINLSFSNGGLDVSFCIIHSSFNTDS